MLNALPVNFPLYPVADPLGLARNQGPIFLPIPYQILDLLLLPTRNNDDDCKTVLQTVF